MSTHVLHNRDFLGRLDAPLGILASLSLSGFEELCEAFVGVWIEVSVVARREIVERGLAAAPEE